MREHSIWGRSSPERVGDGRRRPMLTDDAVSSNAAAAPYTELPCTLSCDLVSEGLRLPVDILTKFFCAKVPNCKIFFFRHLVFARCLFQFPVTAQYQIPYLTVHLNRSWPSSKVQLPPASLGSSNSGLLLNPSRQPPFGTFLWLVRWLLVHLLSPIPLTQLHVPALLRLLDQLRNQFVAPSSASQLRLNLRCRLLRWSGECAQTYRFCTRHDNTQRHSTQDHRRGRNGSQESHTHEQLSCQRQNSPISMYYRFGERARITTRPQIKYARSQSTTSPQICVAFRHFNHQPIIWHRGPRPRAHWYMCTDVAKFPECHSIGANSNVKS